MAIERIWDRQVFHYRTWIPISFTLFVLGQFAGVMVGTVQLYRENDNFYRATGFASAAMLCWIIYSFLSIMNARIIVEKNNLVQTDWLGRRTFQCKYSDIRSYKWRQLRNVDKMTVTTEVGRFAFWSFISNEGLLTEFIADQIVARDELIKSE